MLKVTKRKGSDNYQITGTVVTPNGSEPVRKSSGTSDYAEAVQAALTKRVRKGRGMVPMTAMARAALLEAKAGALTDHVIEWDGEPVAKVRKGFMAAVARAGLDDVTPHTLRHTAASWMEAGGVAMEQIARILSHRNPMTTRTIYAKPDVDAMRPAADVIDMKIRRKKA